MIETNLLEVFLLILASVTLGFVIGNVSPNNKRFKTWKKFRNYIKLK